MQQLYEGQKHPEGTSNNSTRHRSTKAVNSNQLLTTGKKIINSYSNHYNKKRTSGLPLVQNDAKVYSFV